MCFRTVKLVNPLTLVCWDNTIAVGLDSGDIVIIDGTTGTQTGILSGHTRQVVSLAFSLDGTLLASGSGDRTIKLWDVQTGGIVETFYGHTGNVLSVSISADNTTIASGSNDKTIHFWDIQTRRTLHVMKQLGGSEVDCVRFSPTNPQSLMSTAGTKIKWWNTDTFQISSIYDGSHIAFSPDGTQFVSRHREVIVVQNVTSGTITAEFHVAGCDTWQCCFSTNGRLVAVTVNATIYIWDIAGLTPYLVKTFVGHSRVISALEFSSPSSLISLSDDQLVKFWQIGASSTNPALTDLKSTAEIMTITLQAKDGIAISGDLNGVVRTWDISTGFCKSSFQTPAKYPYWSDARLINSRLKYVWYAGKGIHIWDTEGGGFLKTVDGPRGNIDYADVKISEDGSKVFCLDMISLRAWSVQTGKVVGEVNFTGNFRSLTVGDDSQVWVRSQRSKPLGWDFGIQGSSPVQLSSRPLPCPNITKQWENRQSRIKDTVAGMVVLQLAGQFTNPVESQWDGQYLVAGYKSGEVLILDFGHVAIW